jgi:hypothetical protein
MPHRQKGYTRGSMGFKIEPEFKERLMEIKAAQQEVQSVFRGGSVGQMVSGLIWLASAALGSWVSVQYGIIALALGGVFIFPLTQLVLKLLGGPSSLRKDNPFNYLAMQVAFTVPLALPVIGAAALQNVNWFYPAFLIIVGAHYLPFMTLYGMWQYGILAAAMIAGGVMLGMYLPGSFSAGGWFGAAVLLVFAVVIMVIHSRKTAPTAQAA